MARRRRPLPTRALVASARTLKVGNEKDALAIRRTRQPWQPAAWTYRDSIGEIGYAMRFLANSLSRMKLYAAAYDDPNENPIPVDDAKNIPPLAAKLANAAIAELGAGQLALSGLIKPLVENMEVPGECYIVSDPPNIDQLWSIRSMDEIQVLEDGAFLLRDDPEAKLGSVMPQGRPMSPGAYVARMWTPHPRFHAWADSPMRQLIDSCDELLLLSRSIRGIARSRLTGPGILAVAEELSLKRQGSQESDDESTADQFMRELTETMMEPIGDEGSAASVVPIVIRGPYDMIKDGIQQFTFDRDFDDKAVELRNELIGRIATGLDLPKEVIIGTADLNHWSAWQVDDSTFRHHIEPKVLTMVDCLTVAYLRVRLLAEGVDQETVDKIVVWYDPTELVTHPDRTEDALKVWDRFAISNETLREVAGWTEEDAPNNDEMLLRMLMHERQFPPTIVESLFNHFAPMLRILPDVKEPGMGPGDATEPPDQAAPPVLPGDTTAPGRQSPTQRPAPGPPTPQPQPKAGPTGRTGARTRSFALTAPSPSRLSRRLTQIDRSLRERLVVAADAAVRRTLERAGNRVRARLPNEVRLSLSGIASGDIPAALGADRLAEYGLEESALLNDAFEQLHASWSAWVDDANRAALATAVSIGGLGVDDPIVVEARRRQEEAISAGWTVLADKLTALAHALLYNPHPDQPDVTPADIGRTVVPAGTVRSAVAVAGGAGQNTTIFAAAGPGVGPGGRLADGSSMPVPGVSSGPIISDVLDSAGATIGGFRWVHGDATRPYEPHLELDDTEFTDWAGPELQPGDDADWLGVGNFFPGDHDGCTCDVVTDWIEPADSAGGDGGPDGGDEGGGEGGGAITNEPFHQVAPGPSDPDLAAEEAHTWARQNVTVYRLPEGAPAEPGDPDVWATPVPEFNRATPAQKDAADDYQVNSNRFNDYLRHGADLDPARKEQVAALEDLIGSSMIEKNVELFRSIQSPELFQELRVGDVVQDNGFISTSLLHAFEASELFRGTGAARFILETPRGTHGIYMGSLQAEILLKPGTKWTVTKIFSDADGPVIRARVIP